MEVGSRTRILAQLFNLLLCFFGVRWHRGLQCFQCLQFLLWLCWYAVIWTNAVQHPMIFHECTLDCLISQTLFLTLTIAHVIILLDTFMQRHSYRPLVLQTVDQGRHVVICISAILWPIILLEGLSTWCRVRLVHKWNMPVFWTSIPSGLGLQMKLLAFLSDVLVANVRVLGVRERLSLLSRQPMNCWRKPPDIEPVIKIKYCYSQLNHLFSELNLSYGGSLLTIFIVLFFDFVFNSYWMVKFLLIKPDYTEIVYMHLGIFVKLGLIISVICWHCQQSFNHSRQIGCLISKLVKPLGSKRYNDLVCEFLLQTLHQRFVLTAKDFFTLNLHLLSSMFAAVVTYLVILIQFMFAEQGSQAHKKEKVLPDP